MAQENGQYLAGQQHLGTWGAHKQQYPQQLPFQQSIHHQNMQQQVLMMQQHYAAQHPAIGQANEMGYFGTGQMGMAAGPVPQHPAGYMMGPHGTAWSGVPLHSQGTTVPQQPHNNQGPSMSNRFAQVPGGYPLWPAASPFTLLSHFKSSLCLSTLMIDPVCECRFGPQSSSTHLHVSCSPPTWFSKSIGPR